MQLVRNLVVAVVIPLVSACSNVKSNKLVEKEVIPAPEINHSPFPVAHNVLSEAEIFTLTEQQKQDFLNYYYAPERTDIRGDRRLYSYLEGLLTGFDFRGETLTASEAITRGQGNCMSLAVITTALARLVNLKLSYQQVNSLPVYHQQNKVLTISGHVRTKVFSPDFKLEKNQFAIFRPGTVVDYFPSSSDFFGDKVQYKDFVAKFYQNHAAEALLNKQYAKAFSWVKAALEVSPENAESINILAVLYGHVNLPDESASWYQYAINKNMTSVNLYSNYRNLALRQGKKKLAEQLEDQLDLSDGNNPYSWIKLGHEAFSKNDVRTASKHYKKAIQLAPYLADGYLALAKSLYQSGKLKQAAQAMEKAIELSYTPEKRRLYFAKLATITSSQKTDD